MYLYIHKAKRAVGPFCFVEHTAFVHAKHLLNGSAVELKVRRQLEVANAGHRSDTSFASAFSRDSC